MIINGLLVQVIWSHIVLTFPTEIHAAPLIINGIDADPEVFQYYVYLVARFPGNGIKSCGGSLIHSDRVLTAAHCLMNNSLMATSVMVFPNLDNILPDISKSKFYRGYPIVHQLYHDAVDILYNEIGIIKLEEAIALSERIETVCLPEKSYPEGTNVTIAGFGLINASIETDPEYLQKYETSIIGRTDAYHSIFTFTNNQSTCLGDSGGPVVVKTASLEGKCRHVLLGLVSYADGYCSLKSLVHHTDIYHYLDWIKDHM